MIKEYKEDLKLEFKDYSKSKFMKDLMAGATVAAVALPLALAFGVSSGATAAAGLITAIIAGVLIGILSGSSFQISGPTGAMSAILISVVAQYGLEGMFLATLMSGVILIIAGALKLGRIASIIPMPVITGFTSGIAIIIALGQIDNFFGTTSKGESLVGKIVSYRTEGFNIDFKVMLFGILVVALMIIWPKRWQKIMPASLVAIALATILNTLILKWDIQLVGEIPQTLILNERLSLNEIKIDTMLGVITPALSIAALGMIESLLCGTSAGRMKGETLKGDRELMAQGVGSIILPFFGGIPATAAIARTSVAVKSGQQTRLTSIIHALILLLSMFALAPIMSKIPMSALAGVLIVTAVKMNDWDVIRYLFKSKLVAAIIGFFITLMSTVIFDLSIAILVGISFSAIMFTVKVSNTIEVNVSDIDSERLIKRNIKSHHTYDKAKVIYITGSLFFGSAVSVQNTLDKVSENVEVIILSLRGMSSCDSTGIHMLAEFCERAKKKGTEIYFVGVQNRVMEDFRQVGVVGIFGEGNFLWSTEEVLKKMARN